jgi:hypothetical protein
VYCEKGFAEPWFLIVPPDSESWLPTAEVVRLYRQRMQIEQCFQPPWEKLSAVLRIPNAESLLPRETTPPV